MVAGERDRPDVVRRRAQWRKYQNKIEPERLVFVDETWTKTNMAPLRGWGPRGRRIKAKVPYGHWNTTTFLAALTIGSRRRGFLRVRSTVRPSKSMSKESLSPRFVPATS